jgi:hypothetical protein
MTAWTPAAGWQPAAPPAPVRVGLGRSNAVVTLAMLAFLGIVVAVAASSAATADYRSARILGLGIAGLFAIPLVMLLFALPRFLAPRYVVLDAGGLRIQHGKQEVAIGWPQLVAVGIGYEQAAAEPPGLPPTSVDQLQDAVKDYLAGQAAELLHVSDKRRIALEIFPYRADAVEWFPKLKPYWKPLPPPMAGLPPYGWRFPLPPVVSIAQAIDQGARTCQPRRRLGWYPRPWSG